MGKIVGTTVDDRGRITLPQELRERLGISPGEKVRADAVAGGILIRRVSSLTEFIEQFEGSVDSGSLAKKPLDPLKVKEIWGAFHDHD